MTIVVTVTYVLLVMRADNDGEGGIMALITLIRRQNVPRVPGTAVFLNRTKATAPLAMRASVKHLRAHEHVVILCPGSPCGPRS